MVKIYDGKVVIPGDQMKNYVQMLKEAEEQREPFRRELEALNREFREHLLTRFSSRTANKHSQVVSLFIEFLCRHTDVMRLEEVTRGMANTHFKKWWKRKVWDSTKPEQISVALKKFFTFLANEKGIENEKALEAFRQGPAVAGQCQPWP